MKINNVKYYLIKDNNVKLYDYRKINMFYNLEEICHLFYEGSLMAWLNTRNDDPDVDNILAEIKKIDKNMTTEEVVNIINTTFSYKSSEDKIKRVTEKINNTNYDKQENL